MIEIIPRWEWRTFARTIDLQLDLGAYPRTRHVESSEIYLASPVSEGNPKIRDALIDIKALQRVDEDGLEQWKPVLKAAFPLSAEELADVYLALNLPAPSGTGPYDLDDLLAVIDADPQAWAVTADKVRDQYDVEGCTVEISRVSFDGETFQTVAAEDPDPGKVKDTVALLGLAWRENISYVKAAQRARAGTLA